MEKINVSFYGSEKVKKVEEKLFDEIIRQKLTGDESYDRIIIQEFIDANKIKSAILYDGNTVYGKEKIIKEIHKLIEKGTLTTMSDYLYHFIINSCGSIAHYNKNGWIEKYDNSIDKLMGFFLRNEFSQDVYKNTPTWYSDLKVIASEIVDIAKTYKKGTYSFKYSKANVYNQNQLNLFALV